MDLGLFVTPSGGRLDPFFPSRGIRQGDPLSPYLFILCMEYLGHLIEEKCSQKLWNPVKSSQGGLFFSHLMFADDVVLFAKADQGNCVVIRDALDTFCSRTGQTISEAKSWVFFFSKCGQRYQGGALWCAGVCLNSKFRVISRNSP